MNYIKVSATKARNNFFELLNQIALGDTEVVIERDRKEVAVISPKKQIVDWVALKKASKAVHGIWKDYDPEDNPLRRRNAWPSLGKWDKGLKFKK